MDFYQVVKQTAKLLQQQGKTTSYGMDLETLMKVLSQSTGNSFIGENWSFIKTARPHLMPLAKKDLDLCIEAAHANNISMPLVEARRALSWELNTDD